MALELAGQVALITGGGRGIGRAMAEATARAGASVSVLGRTEQELNETVKIIVNNGGKAISVTCDVTRRHDVAAAVVETEQRLGPVDLLVNNAGSAQALGPLWEADPDEWWNDVEVNIRGTFLCCHEVLPGMIRRRKGRIINVSSLAGTMTMPMNTGYACSKAAVLRLTDGVAASVKDYGIAVFAVSPGLVHTRMSDHLLTSAGGRRYLPEFQNLGPENWTPPERVAELVVSLGAGRADALSGRFIHVRQNLEELVRNAEVIRQKDLYIMRLREE